MAFVTLPTLPGTFPAHWVVTLCKIQLNWISGGGARLYFVDLRAMCINKTILAVFPYFFLVLDLISGPTENCQWTMRVAMVTEARGKGEEIVSGSTGEVIYY